MPRGLYPRISDGPTYWLAKHKTTTRPRPCVYCKQNGYYYHKSYGYLCAAHLTDLINVGETLWKWNEYPEIWERLSRLLQREAPPSTTATVMEYPEKQEIVEEECPLDGTYHD